MSIASTAFREIVTSPSVISTGTGGGVLGSIYQAGRTLFGIGRSTLGTNTGRMLIGAGAGAVMGYNSGDEYTSSNSRFTRMAAGALGGAAVAATFNVATSRVALGSYKHGAKIAGKVGLLGGLFGAGEVARGTSNVVQNLVRDAEVPRAKYLLNKAFGPGTFSKREIADDFVTNVMIPRVKGAIKVGTGLAGVSVGALATYGAASGYVGIKNQARQARRARFQDSATGVVQGSHSGRHG